MASDEVQAAARLVRSTAGAPDLDRGGRGKSEGIMGEGSGGEWGWNRLGFGSGWVGEWGGGRLGPVGLAGWAVWPNLAGGVCDFVLPFLFLFSVSILL